ncbi:MAG: hypothetical protein PHE29_13455 [Tissierellia bacterium]|nr:hypothetical protein [Tissierellia bacterium]MDD4779224.1 hypothetical protein [Tissierellia bacterium]
MANFKNVKFTNGATKEAAKTILNRIKNDIAFREQEVIDNLSEVERNTDVPAGYIQYWFYDKNGEGFQAGKYANGSYGISQ